MQSVIPSDYEVGYDLGFIQKYLNTGLGIRLFTNNFVPTVASLITDFAEASFFGYARQTTAGMFAAPLKVASGSYVSQSNAFNFPTPNIVPQNIYGWYISGPTTWYYAGVFPIPLVAVSPGPISFTISLALQSLSIPCP